MSHCDLFLKLLTGLGLRRVTRNTSFRRSQRERDIYMVQGVGRVARLRVSRLHGVSGLHSVSGLRGVDGLRRVGRGDDDGGRAADDRDALTVDERVLISATTKGE